MNNFKSKYKENIELLDELNKEKIDKKYMRRSMFFGAVITILVISFAYFILSELFKQYSSVALMFKFLILIFAILVFIVCPGFATITQMIYKYYSKNEKLYQIKWFYTFLHELISVSNLIISIIATIVLTILLCRLAG